MTATSTPSPNPLPSWSSLRNNMKESVPVSVNPSDTPNSIATTPSSCSTSSLYQELLNPQIPHAGHKDEAAVKVIAGDSHSLKSQIYIRTPTMLLDFKISKNQTITHTIPETYKRLIDVLNGIAYIGDLGYETEVKAHHTLLLSEDGASTVRIKTKDEEAKFMLIAGEP